MVAGGLPFRRGPSPLRLDGAAACAFLLATCHSSRRSSSSASFIQLTTWNGSITHLAFGHPLFTGSRIQRAPSAVTTSMAPLLAGEPVEEEVDHVLAPALVRPDEAPAVVVDHHGDVAVALLAARLVDADAPESLEPADVALVLSIDLRPRLRPAASIRSMPPARPGGMSRPMVDSPKARGRAAIAGTGESGSPTAGPAPYALVSSAFSSAIEPTEGTGTSGLRLRRPTAFSTGPFSFPEQGLQHLDSKRQWPLNWEDSPDSVTSPRTIRPAPRRERTRGGPSRSSRGRSTGRGGRRRIRGEAHRPGGALHHFSGRNSSSYTVSRPFYQCGDVASLFLERRGNSYALEQKLLHRSSLQLLKSQMVFC